MLGLMTWLIPTLVGIVGYTFAFRRIAGQLAWYYCAAHNKSWGKYGREHLYNSPNGEQWCGAIVLALITAIIWPISLPIAYGLEGSHKGGKFFYIPKDQKERIYKQRIAALEKEVGIQ